MVTNSAQKLSSQNQTKHISSGETHTVFVMLPDMLLFYVLYYLFK